MANPFIGSSTLKLLEEVGALAPDWKTGLNDEHPLETYLGQAPEIVGRFNAFRQQLKARLHSTPIDNGHERARIEYAIRSVADLVLYELQCTFPAETFPPILRTDGRVVRKRPK